MAEVETSGKKEYWLRLAGRKKVRVCTVRQACRLLHRSRRQVYRCIQEGLLPAYGKFLGEWLLDETRVTHLSVSPSHLHSLPTDFQPFFPEYHVKDLNPGRDRTVVLSRLLESGGRGEVRWVFKRYKKGEIINFLLQDGSRLLSSRSLNFWTVYFGIKLSMAPSWRRQVWPFGGVG